MRRKKMLDANWPTDIRPPSPPELCFYRHTAYKNAFILHIILLFIFY